MKTLLRALFFNGKAARDTPDPNPAGLPDEIWALVLDDLEPHMRIPCAFVCRRWRRIVGPLSAHLRASLCPSASLRGEPRMLRWAKENGFPWNETVCSMAALAGHLDVLRTVRRWGCPWDEFTCACAARGGHLDVLRWARANGCPWNRWTLIWANENLHWEVSRWVSDEDSMLGGRAGEIPVGPRAAEGRRGLRCTFLVHRARDDQIIPCVAEAHAVRADAMDLGEEGARELLDAWWCVHGAPPNARRPELAWVLDSYGRNGWRVRVRRRRRAATA